jgi:hypothetical protein
LAPRHRGFPVASLDALDVKIGECGRGRSRDEQDDDRQEPF